MVNSAHPFQAVPRIVRLTDRKSRKALVGVGAREWGASVPWGIGFYFVRMKGSGGGWLWWLHNSIKVLTNAAELHIQGQGRCKTVCVLPQLK